MDPADAAGATGSLGDVVGVVDVAAEVGVGLTLDVTEATSEVAVLVTPLTGPLPSRPEVSACAATRLSRIIAMVASALKSTTIITDRSARFSDSVAIRRHRPSAGTNTPFDGGPTPGLRVRTAAPKLGFRSVAVVTNARKILWARRGQKPHSQAPGLAYPRPSSVSRLREASSVSSAAGRQPPSATRQPTIGPAGAGPAR